MLWRAVVIRLRRSFGSAQWWPRHEAHPRAVDQLGDFSPPLTNDNAFSSVSCHVCPSPLKTLVSAVLSPLNIPPTGDQRKLRWDM